MKNCNELKKEKLHSISDKNTENEFDLEKNI